MDNLREKSEKLRALLRGYRLTNLWMVEQLSRRGVALTPDSFCNILRLRTKGKFTVKVIDMSLNILVDYEEKFLSA